MDFYYLIPDSHDGTDVTGAIDGLNVVARQRLAGDLPPGVSHAAARCEQAQNICQ